MFGHPRQLSMWILCALLGLFAPQSTQSQLVATRDLTLPSPPAPNGPLPGDFSEDYKDACGSSEMDGDLVEKKGDHLDLSIVDAQPEMRDGQARLMITVRLKNLNVYAAAEVPWEISPVVPVQTNPNDPTVTQEAATIWVWMKLQKPAAGLASLRGGVTFVAQPKNPAQHMRLRPGEWVDIKFPVEVVCESKEQQVCSRYLSGDVVQLTAWWFERNLTHLRKGCVVTDGAYTTREFDSTPYALAHSPPPKPEIAAPVQPATSKFN